MVAQRPRDMSNDFSLSSGRHHLCEFTSLGFRYPAFGSARSSYASHSRFPALGIRDFYAKQSETPGTSAPPSNLQGEGVLMRKPILLAELEGVFACRAETR